MTDYSKLVEALRDIEKTMFALGTSPINMDNVSISLAYDKGWGQTANDAADAIEALQKDLTTLQKCYEIADTTVDKVVKQLPKRGEWELIDGAEPMRWGCSRCKYMSWETSTYCPRCGAKMEAQE